MTPGLRSTSQTRGSGGDNALIHTGSTNPVLLYTRDDPPPPGVLSNTFQAEVGLRTSIAKAPVSHADPKIVVKATKPVDMSAIEAAKEELRRLRVPKIEDDRGDARGLLKRMVKVRKEGDYKKIQKLIESRRERHYKAEELFTQQLMGINEDLQKHIVDVSKQLKELLFANDGEIASIFATLEDQKLLSYEIDDVNEAWSRIEAVRSSRNELIDEFSEHLEQLEVYRKERIDTELRALMLSLVDIAHEVPPVIERLVEDRTHELQLALIDNKRAHSDLMCRMRTKDVVRWRAQRAAWEERLAAWRRLRHDRAVYDFRCTIASTSYQYPQKRLDLFDGLRVQQGKLFHLLSEQIDTFNTLQPPLLTKDIGEQWRESLNVLLERMENTHTDFMSALHRQEDSLYEESKELFEKLREDTQRFGALEADDLENFLTKDVEPVIHDRHDYVEVLLDRSKSFLERQLDYYRDTCNVLVTMTEHLGELWDTHLETVVRIDNDLESNHKSRRHEHETHDANAEEDLDTTKTELRQGPNDSRIAESLAKALDLLQSIEEGYRSFYSDSISIAKKHPEDKDEEMRLYNGKLQEFFGCKDDEDAVREEEELREMIAEREKEKEEAEAAGGGKKPAKGKGDEPEEEEEELVEPEPFEYIPGETYFESNSGRKYRIVRKLEEELFAEKAWFRRGDPVFDPPPPPPEPEEPEEQEEETPAKGKDKKDKKAKKEEVQDEPEEEQEEEAPPEPPTPWPPVDYEDPKPCVSELTIASEKIIEIIRNYRLNFLNQLEAHKEVVLKQDNDHFLAVAEELTNELDSRLRRHRPRAGRIELDVFEMRQLELLAHRQRFERHVRHFGQRAATMEEHYVSTLNETDAMYQRYLADLETLTTELGTASNLDTVARIEREGVALYEDPQGGFKKKLEERLSDMDETCGDYEAQLKKANVAFVELEFKLFSEEGNYHPEEVDVFRERLDLLGKEAEEMKIGRCENNQMVVEKLTAAAGEACDAYKANVELHREDLTFLSEQRRKYGSANTNLRAEIAASEQTQNQIDTKLDQLKDLCTSERRRMPDGTTRSMTMLQLLQDLRETVFKRSMYLKCLESLAIDVSEEIDIADPEDNWVEPVEEVEDTSKDKKGKKGKDDKKDKKEEKKKDDKKKDAKKAGKDKGKKGGDAEEHPAREDPDIPTFVGNAEQQREKCSEELLKIVGAYYESKGERTITRPYKIPRTLRKHERLTAEQVDKLKQLAEKHSDEAIKALRLQLAKLAQLLVRVPEALFRFVSQETLEEKEDMQSDLVAQFQRARKQWEAQRVHHKSQLTPDMSSPNLDKELQQLCQDEEERHNDAMKLVDEHEKAMKMLEQRFAERFQQRLEHRARVLHQLLDSMAMQEDLVPGEKVVVSERKTLMRLKWEAAANAQVNDLITRDGSPFKSTTWSGLPQKTLSLDAYARSRVERGLDPVPEESEEFVAELSEDYEASYAPPQQAVITHRDRSFHNFKNGWMDRLDDLTAECARLREEEVMWVKNWHITVDFLKGM